jgi:FdrA protein
MGGGDRAGALAVSGASGPVVRCSIRRGEYRDSVVLLELQRGLAALPGVLEAGVVMATPANREVLAAGALMPAEAEAAGPSDLLIVVRAESGAAAEEALARFDELERARRPAADAEHRPASLEAALRRLPRAGWVLVSVPGRWAGGVAREALAAGRHVFLYSDNVPVAEEVALKDEAARRGLLLLGPDCGTAIVGGVGLGFANRVRRGPVGVVAASGTGLQAVTSRLHALGQGISHALGTGGRDLGRDVGGRTALPALDLLRRDPETRVIVLLSKPPAAEVGARLLAAAATAGKPVVVHFLDQAPPGRRLGPLRFAASLADAAELAADLAGAPPVPSPPGADHGPPPALAPGQRFVRGLFSGGTLAAETLVGLRPFLAPLASNLALAGVERVDARDPAAGGGCHRVLDLGADELTVGRPHPMIDHELLLRHLRREAADPQVAALLVDVVLGDGAHPDPAADLGPAIAEARAAASAAGQDLGVVAILVGTDADPQDARAQAERLRAAGAHTAGTVEEAVERLVGWLGAGPLPAAPPPAAPVPAAPVPLAALAPPLVAVNVGLESFHRSLRDQGADAVHVDWRPPAGGDERLAGILARLKG